MDAMKSEPCNMNVALKQEDVGGVCPSNVTERDVMSTETESSSSRCVVHCVTEQQLSSCYAPSADCNQIMYVDEHNQTWFVVSEQNQIDTEIEHQVNRICVAGQTDHGLNDQLDSIRKRKELLRKQLTDVESMTQQIISEQNRKIDDIRKDIEAQQLLEARIAHQLLDQVSDGELMEVDALVQGFDGTSHVIVSDEMAQSLGASVAENRCDLDSEMVLTKVEQDREKSAEVEASAAETVFVCFLCGLRYQTMTDCQTHWTTEHGVVLLSCPTCHIKFLTESELNKHVLSHRPSVGVTRRRRVTKQDGRHQSSAGQKPNTKAKMISYESSKDGIKEELSHNADSETANHGAMEATEADTDGVQTDSNDGKIFTCSQCAKDLPSEKSYDRHMNVTHGKKYQCRDCNKRFKNLCNLQRHARVHTGEKPYLCPDCGQTFRVVDNLVLHMRTHSADRPFACQHCSATYKRKDKLRMHVIQKHETEKLLMCALCDRRFVSPYLLRDHLRVHSDERPFECDLCSKRFHSKIRLDSHRRQTHRLALQASLTSDAPNELQCMQCGRIMSCKASLTVHMRRHAGVYPYVCGTCGKRFACRAELTLHSQTHSTDRPFSCELCGTLFKRKKTLIKHQLSHKGEQKFPCKYCDAVFRTDSAMYLHRRRNHAVKLQTGAIVSDEPFELTEVIIELAS